MSAREQSQDSDSSEARRDIFRLYEEGLLDENAATVRLLALDRDIRRVASARAETPATPTISNPPPDYKSA